MNNTATTQKSIMKGHHYITTTACAYESPNGETNVYFSASPFSSADSTAQLVADMQDLGLNVGIGGFYEANCTPKDAGFRLEFSGKIERGIQLCEMKWGKAFCWERWNRDCKPHRSPHALTDAIEAY